MVVATLTVTEPTPTIRTVSIPGGFSWSLRHEGKTYKWSTGQMFQSLAGFLGRCDVPALDLPKKERHGFNPWRVFLVVATAGSNPAETNYETVSIPGGFSWSLRLPSVNDDEIMTEVFQSLAGFLGRCDYAYNNVSALTFTVSIPGGFSWSLRLKSKICWFISDRVSIPGGFSWSLRLRVW